MGGEEEATAVPLGLAPVTARLLQSRVGEVEVEDITVDSGVEEAVETLLLSRIGGTVAGLAAQMCLRIARCSQWGEALIPPNHPLRPLATLFPRSPAALLNCCRRLKVFCDPVFTLRTIELRE